MNSVAVRKPVPMRHFISAIRSGTDPEIVRIVENYVPAGGRTLEAGCSTGLLSLDLALERKTTPILLDINPREFKRAQEFFAHFGLKPSCIVGDVQDIPLQDNEVDVCFNEGVLEHDPIDVQKAVREMLRVSRIAAVVVIPDGDSLKYRIMKLGKRLLGIWEADKYGHERSIKESRFKGLSYEKILLPYNNVAYIFPKKALS
jgi:SAM-dependent methyltransferase